MKGTCLVKALVVVTYLVLFTSTSALAQVDFCEGNFDFDQDVDGGDAFTFKQNFGRSALKNPCPPDGPAPAQKTGQITLYETGDDGDLKKGMAWPDPRFVDNGDGTVTDKLNGLFWLKNASCFGASTWSQAISDCSGLASGACSFTDGSSPGEWRLPNIDELLSLIDRSQTAPALPSGTPFVDAQADAQASNYWSSTSSSSNTDSAWFVFFADGYSDFNPKATASYVWPVRGGR
jgi:hypothetical protein